MNWQRVSWIVALICTGGVFAWLSLQSQGGPKVLVKSTDISLGQVPVESTVFASVEIANVGSQDLVISNLKASCGCTHAALSSSRLRSGSKATLKMEFRDHDPGNVRHSLELHTNDVANEVVLIHVSYTRRDQISFFPKQVDFGLVNRDGLPRSLSVTFAASDGVRFEPELRNVPAPFIANVQGKDTEHLLGIELPPTMPSGIWAEQLVVFDRASGHEFTIPIIAHVRGLIQADPNSLLFVIEESRRSVEQSIRFSSGSSGLVVQNVEKEPVTADDQTIGISTDVEHDANVSKVVVSASLLASSERSISKDRAPSTIRGALRIEAVSEAAGTEVIRVPYVVVVKRFSAATR